jgi:hypothetical protein
LRGFLRREAGFDVELLLAQPEVAVGDEHQQHDRQSDDDQREEHVGRLDHHAFPPF